MPQCQVRIGTEADAQAALDLIKELAVYEREPEAVKVTLEEFISDWKQSIFRLFVAEQEGKVIGLALYYIRYSTWNGPCLYLEDLVVSNKYRGQGVGDLLFRALLRKMLEKKYRLMTWQVLDWNEPAMNFYRKYGADLENDWLNGKLDLARAKKALANDEGI